MAARKKSFRQIKHRSSAPRPRGKVRTRNTCRALVPVDQDPMRRKAIQGCRRAKTQLGKVQEEWTNFENVDRPAFDRWYHKTFGALLTRLRVEQNAIAEKQRIAEEVEFELVFGTARDAREAYRDALRRRNSPEADEEETSEGSDKNDSKSGEEEAFRTYFRNVYGFDEDEIDEMYRKYQESQSGFHDRSESNPQPGPNNEPEPHLVSRVKDRYRHLARKLHPDMLTADDTRKLDLWHEVQEAYKTCDLERLDTIVALCEVEDGQVTEGIALSQLESVQVSLKEALRSMRAEVRRAKKSPAWDFSKKTDLRELKAQFETEINESLRSAKKESKALDELIAEWSRPIGFGSHPPRPTARRNSRTRHTCSNPNQSEFVFT